MSDIDARQIERMKSLLAGQQDAFARDRHRPLNERKADLEAVQTLTAAHAGEIADAIASDYGVRSKAETQLGEIGFVLASAKHALKNLDKWAKPQKASVPMTLAPGKAYVRREPKGVAGIVSPWNYPYQLAIAPLIAALAAGCRAMIKPSEYTPATAELMKRLLGERFSEDQVAVVTGGPSVGEAFTALPFDHLFYTGSTHVGRIVAKAAAENLTPVTLELGGKSPAIVTESYETKDLMKPLAWGKFFNAGQTCVAPDYVLVPNRRVEEIGEALIATVSDFYPDLSSDDDYTAIVSQKHYDRLSGMIEEARAAGARILQPEHDVEAARAARKIPPTVILNLPEDSPLMQEEIFGPVLPVLGYELLSGAIDFVNGRDRPLALYVFSKEKSQSRRVLEQTMSGGASVNATMLHLSVEDMPFGGVGKSGYGAYHGERGFLEFTHERSVFEAPVWHPSRLIAPPYGKMFDFIAGLQKR